MYKKFPIFSKFVLMKGGTEAGKRLPVHGQDSTSACHTLVSM